jgi:hypothetical protein
MTIFMFVAPNSQYVGLRFQKRRPTFIPFQEIFLSTAQVQECILLLICITMYAYEAVPMFFIINMYYYVCLRSGAISTFKFLVRV